MSTLLETALPEREFRGIVSIPVRASGAALFRALHEVRLTDMPLARALGTLRYLPARLFGRAPPPATERAFIDELVASGQVILGELPERELVIGNVGKLHRVLDQQFVPMHEPTEFYGFADPGYEKLAMSVRIEETHGWRRLVLEHRTHALGPESHRAFSHYWIIIKPLGNFVSWLLLRAVRRLAEKEVGLS